MENDSNTATTNPKLDSGEEPKTNVEPEQQEREDERGENPNLNSATEEEAPRQPSSRRTPFTNLSQVDADLALARTLQEQERAYMMLTMGNSGSDYGSWEAGSYLDDYDDDDDEEEEEDEEEGDEDEDDDDFGDSGVGGEDDGHGEVEINGTDVDEDAFDVHAHSHGDGGESNARADTDPAAFDSDEAYARALQDAEEREMAARLFALAGIHDINDIIGEAEVIEDNGANSQETWEEVDPDELSYEELIALGEVVGTESRGLSAATIASLPSINYKLGNSQNGSNDSCVICRLDYEDDETLTLLSCKHSYHSECINNWLKINKVCPVCSTEVSTSGHS